jgi:hypothetical protein
MSWPAFRLSSNGGRFERNSWPMPVLRESVRSHNLQANLLAALALLLCAACLVAAPAGAAPSLSWSSPTFIDGDGAPSAIACPSLALCVAVDDHGNALLSADPASVEPTWSLQRAIDPGQALNAVSCASTALCVAVDGRGDVLTSTDPLAGASANWSTLDVDGANALNAVSCASTALCVAVDAAGNVLASSNPAAGSGSSWSAHGIDLDPPLVSVSCATAELCIAVDSSGNVLASLDPTSGRPTWSSTTIDPLGAPASVSCIASELCVSVDRSGRALASDAPATGTPAWLEPQVDPAGQLVGVSCTPDGFCAAIDGSGHVLAAHVPTPTVVTGLPNEITQTAATLMGTVNSYDATLSACRFEYGPSIAYGESISCASLPPAADGTQAASALLSGLAANTTYHYRLAISSPLAGTVYGLDQTVTTQSPPLVQPHPSIGGTPAIGQRLTCKSGVTATGVTLTYAWLRDLGAIGGANGSTYVVTSADVSHHLQCRVTATNAAGGATATSAFVTVPAGGLGAVSETTVGTPRVQRGAVSVPLRCSGQAAGSCTITLRLTAVETLRGTRIVAIAASRHASHSANIATSRYANVAASRPANVAASRRATVTLGASTAHLRPGQQLTATIFLNATGRRLLAHYRRMPAKLSVSGTVVGAVKASLASATITLSASAQAASHPRVSRQAAAHPGPTRRVAPETSSHRRR